jgi:signal transduction histidine kinase
MENILAPNLNIAFCNEDEQLESGYLSEVSGSHNFQAFKNPTELRSLQDEHSMDLIILNSKTRVSAFKNELRLEQASVPVVLVNGSAEQVEELKAIGVRYYCIKDRDSFKYVVELLAETSSLRQLHEDAKRFAPRVVHEIKNPFSVIVQAIETIGFQASKTDNAILIEATHRAKYGIDRLNETMSTMMTLDTGQVENVRPKITISEIVDIIKSSAEDLIDQYADCPPIAIVAGETAEKLLVEFQPAQLRQIILNLLKNAYQAIDDKTGVSIRVELDLADRSYLTISFIDNGPGIPQSLRGKIFRTDFTTKSNPDSQGIGLALCRKIAHKNKAELMLDSESEETKFDLLIPYSAA